MGKYSQGSNSAILEGVWDRSVERGLMIFLLVLLNFMSGELINRGLLISWPRGLRISKSASKPHRPNSTKADATKLEAAHAAEGKTALYLKCFITNFPRTVFLLQGSFGVKVLLKK